MLKEVYSYSRKLLSVILAVMMLLTAWVFVAPEKASAVTATFKSYKAVFQFKITDDGDDDNIKVVVWANGYKNYGASSSIDDIDSKTWGTKNTGTWDNQEISLGTAVPSGLEVHFYRTGASVSRSAAFQVNNINFYGVKQDNGTVWIGSQSNFSGSKNAKNWDQWYGDQNVLSRPTISTNLSATSGSINIPYSSDTTKTFTSWASDNRSSTKLPIPTNSSVGSMTQTFNDNNDPTTKVSLNNYSDRNDNVLHTLKIPTTAHNGGVSSRDVTVDVKYTSGNRTSTTKTYTLTLNDYAKLSFDVNGGTSISPSSPYYTYDKKIPAANIPSSGVRRGYDFLAMYSTPKTSYDFTKPTVGTTSGYTAELKSTREYSTDATYYAAWWAKNCEVIFLDNNGQIVGTATGKYDKALTGSNSAIKDLNFDTDKITVNEGGDPLADGIAYKKGPSETGTFDYEWDGWRVVEAYQYNADGSNSQSEYTGNYYDEIGGALTGKTYYQATYKPKQHSYNIKFYGTNNNILSNTPYQYGATILKPANQSKAEDNTYSYAFRGWTPVSAEDLAALGNNTYYIVNSGTETSDGPDGYTDGGAFIPVQSTWNVVRDTIFVPVFTKTYKNYTVTFVDAGTQTTTYTNKHYNETVEVPATVESYTAGGYRYRAQGWSPAIEDGTTEVAVTGNKTYTMQYGPGEPAVYTVRFYDYNGTQLNEGADQITHNTDVALPSTQPTNTYRDAENEYTWTGKYQNAAGDKVISNGYTASGDNAGDVDWYAKYDSAPLYTISYYDGEDLIGTAQQVAGAAILDYDIEHPTKAADHYASNYTFDYWTLDDAKVTASTLMPAEDISVYAHYDPEIIDYTVKFVDREQPYAEGTYTYAYGDEITVPADPADYADATYRYQFKGWDKAIPETVGEAFLAQADENNTVTYTSEYRKSYQYYNVKWLNDDGTQYKSENYIYNASINAPYQNPSPKNEYQYDPTVSDIVFDHWEYSDGRIYHRGDKVTQDEILTAKFTTANAVRTITFLDEDGTQLAQNGVAYGTAFGDIENTPVPVKAATDDVHYTLAAWTLDGSDIDAGYTVTSNITLQARYTSAAHEWKLTDVTTKPTFWAAGESVWTCSVCEKHQTRTVDPLEDHTAPTTAIFIRNNSWRNVYDASFDEQTPVSRNNFVSLTTGDKGDYNEDYNPDEIGSGVYTIDYAIVTDAAYAAAPQTIPNWTNAYTAASQTEITEDQGNSTARLYQLAGFDAIAEDGDFVIVAKVTDRKGNTIYGNTGVLVLDNTAPEVTITSDSQSGNKHCTEAFINFTDKNDIESAKVDGVDLVPDQATGEFKYSAAGIHQAVVTDIAGNETRVNFEIVGAHNPKTTTKAATCTEDGYTRIVCSLCGKTISEIVIPAAGHQEATRKTPASCTEAGKIITYCTVCSTVISEETDPDAPAAGHQWTDYYEVAATCSAEGFKEQVCSVCDESQTLVLPVDPDAHSYYRAVTAAPTCTEAGEKYEICKHCGYKHVISTTEPTGHVEEGEVVVTVEPKCEEPGEQKVYCLYHGPESDAPYVIRTEEVAALGHNWVIDHVVEPTTETEGYTVYKCTRCQKTENRDYVPALVEYTVTFDVEGTATTVTKGVGETISADDAPDTTKTADADNKYSFAGWADENGTIVELPFDVSGDVTLTATYTATPINYTIRLHREDGTVIWQNGFNKNRSTVDLSGYTLTKAADAEYTYDFAGWGAENAETGATTYTINGADVDLYPVFTATVREYNVVFMTDNTSAPLQTVKVAAHGDAEYTAAEPTKDYDNVYHYTFSGWDKPLTNILADTIVYAQFTATAHATQIESTVPATCTNDGKTIYKCSCGYTVETPIAKIGHHFTTEEPYENAEGKFGWLCGVCNEFIEDTSTYTVRFMNDDGSSSIKTIAYVNYGEDISSKLPADPTKADDEGYRYTFAGWATAANATADDVVAVATTVKKDATYYAVFDKEPIVHKVVYAIDADHVIAIYNVANNASVAYDIENEGTPTKDDSNDYGHLVFNGWSEGDGDTGYIEHVTRNMYITAKFKRVSHTYVDGATVPATCTEPAKLTKTCTECGYNYTSNVGKALGHDYVETSRDDAHVFFTCTRCGDVKVEDIENVPSTDIIAVITVRDSAGNAVEGAKVSLYDGSTFINSGVTGSDGIVRLKVPEAKEYTIVIESGNGRFQDQTGKITVNGDGSTSISGVNIPNQHCSCACHKDGLWGTIFRFFHKIIKLITGKFQCCDNPDPRYY